MDIAVFPVKQTLYKILSHFTMVCVLAGTVTFARTSVTHLHDKMCFSFMFEDQEEASDLPPCHHQCAVQGPSQGWNGREGAAGRGASQVLPLRTSPDFGGMKWPLVAALPARVLGLTEQF